MDHKRIRTCIETEFEVSGRRATGQIKNVSEGGLFVGTAAVPEEGENVDLSFRAPGGGQITVSGMVWWTTPERNPLGGRKPGFGLRLLDECEDFRRLVDSL